METPEQARKKLGQAFAVAIGSTAVVALSVAVLWPRGEEITKDRERASAQASAQRRPSGDRPRAHRISVPAAPGAAEVLPEAPGAESELSYLDEPTPKITVEVKQDEARAFEIDQERRRATLEQELKARLPPEQQRARERGQKIWQERLRTQQ